MGCCADQIDREEKRNPAAITSNFFSFSFFVQNSRSRTRNHELMGERKSVTTALQWKEGFEEVKGEEIRTFRKRVGKILKGK